MSAFDDILEDDAALFADADGFPGTETFTYHRHGKASVRMSGPVFRDPPEFDPSKMANVRHIRVFVAKAQIPSVDCPGDTIELAATLGGTAEKHTVKEILNQDAGGFKLLVG